MSGEEGSGAGGDEPGPLKAGDAGGPAEEEPGFATVLSDYVRTRHCVLLRASFGPVFEDLELHLLQNGHALELAHRAMLRDALAAIGLHLTSRPFDELTAWTLNFRDPPLNLFATGESLGRYVTGRVFTRDVATVSTGRMFVQTSRPRLPVRQSVVEVEGDDVLACVEQYYRHSEQLPARLFRHGDGDYAMLVAHPDYDAPWFETVDPGTIREVARHEELGPLERRGFRLGCGCTRETILRMLRGATGGDLDELYGDLDELRIECPRCAAVFRVPRDELARYVEARASGAGLVLGLEGDPTAGGPTEGGPTEGDPTGGEASATGDDAAAGTDGPAPDRA